MLTAAAGVQTRGFGLSYHGWGEGAGSRAAFRHIPSCHLCPGRAEWTPEQHRAACASLKCCLQQEGTCHILGAHSHRNPGAACGQKQQVCFASQPLTTISLPFNSHPKWLEVPQKPHSKYWSFYTGVVFSHTDFSCNLPHHVQGDPKTGVGKGNSSSQGISGDSPALLHSSWFKHYSHMMQITEPPQRTVPQAGRVQVLPEKAILLWHDLCQISHHPPECFLPHHMPALAQLPTCCQGCSTSQIKELTLVLITTHQKFPQTSALVILFFLCTQCEAGLKAQGLYNSAVW